MLALQVQKSAHVKRSICDNHVGLGEAEVMTFHPVLELNEDLRKKVSLVNNLLFNT